MWTSIITALIPFAIKILTSFFKKKDDANEAKKAFLNFVQVMEKDSGNSAKLKLSYQEQLKRLRNENNK